MQIGPTNRGRSTTLRRVDTPPRTDIGRRIAAARGLAGLTQGELAQALSASNAYGEPISQTSVSRIEKDGENFSPRDWKSLLPAIADICDVPITWFLADLTRVVEIADPRTVIAEETAAAIVRAEERRLNKPPKRNVPRTEDQ